MDPYLGILSISSGSILPYATTTIRSGFKFLIFSINDSSFILSGCNILLCVLKFSFIGGGLKVFPLPFGASGFVIIAITFSLLIKDLREGTANSDVPINIMFNYLPFLNLFLNSSLFKG